MLRTCVKGRVREAIAATGVQAEVLARMEPRRVEAPPSIALRAIVEALLPEGAPSELDRVAAADQAAWFVQRQIEALPTTLRLLLRVGLIGFRSWVAMRYARGFCALDLETRRRATHSWSFGRWAPARQLFRALRGPALLAYYDSPVGVDSPTSGARG